MLQHQKQLKNDSENLAALNSTGVNKSCCDIQSHQKNKITSSNLQFQIKVHDPKKIKINKNLIDVQS